MSPQSSPQSRPFSMDGDGSEGSNGAGAAAAAEASSGLRTNNNKGEADPPSSSTSGILETILQQKMAALATTTTSVAHNNNHVFARTNSVDSVCSGVSAASTLGGGSGSPGVGIGGGDDRCRCDDCILGITDLLAEQEAARLRSIEEAAEKMAVGGGGASAAEAKISVGDAGDARPVPYRRKVGRLSRETSWPLQSRALRSLCI